MRTLFPKDKNMTKIQRFPAYYITFMYPGSTALLLYYVWPFIFNLDARLLITWAIVQFLGMFGINICYHHLVTHKSYTTNAFWKIILCYLGGLATQSSPNNWSLVHLTHHRYTDTDRDPHSPNLDNPVLGVLRAALPLFMSITISDMKVNLMAKKSFDDPIFRFFDMTHMLWFWLTHGAVYYFLGWEWFLLLSVFPVALVHFGETAINCFHFDLERHDSESDRFWWIWNILIIGAGNHKLHHDTPRDYKTDWPIDLFIDRIKT